MNVRLAQARVDVWTTGIARYASIRFAALTAHRSSEHAGFDPMRRSAVAAASGLVQCVAMDFMKWLNSLGDLLYEVMSWLIFYPITLWRTITSPLDTMGYSDRELQDSADEQFTDTLNPPLFLVLSLLLTQAVDVALAAAPIRSSCKRPD